MSAATERPLLSPIAALFAAPERYGFFQAVRLLLLHGQRGERRLHVPAELLRFGATAHLAFPATEIAALDPAPATEHAAPQRMLVEFMGLTGPSGILPRHYTEWLIALRQARDPAARDFLDLFNHRLIALFWQAWARHQSAISAEFDGVGVQRYVYDLVGLGTPKLYAGLGLTRAGLYSRKASTDAASVDQPSADKPPRLPAPALGYYAGLIAKYPHSAGSLSQVMSDYLGAPVTVESCVGTWQSVPSADRTRLGRTAATLGRDCLVGSRYWDRQTTLRLRVGPLSGRRFDALIPRGGGASGLLDGAVELARFMTGLALDLRIALNVIPSEAPTLAPSANPHAPRRPRLGWNTWLGTSHKKSHKTASADYTCQFQFSATGGQSWR
ncbi:MAG: type VI secretion system baseplate subunit TssG [Pseudomonadales bacterium]|jgi:type VI secretion system protein ImpH|nr:type VI secretion system baseplate subunit TssG [Pseudomonadales bacterium]